MDAVLGELLRPALDAPGRDGGVSPRIDDSCQ